MKRWHVVTDAHLAWVTSPFRLIPDLLRTDCVRYLFREASEAVLTPYDAWTQMMRATTLGSDERAAGIAANFEALPSAKRTVLTVLFQHLHKVVALHEINKMAPRNIGVVFGPTLLRIGSEVSDIADIPLAAQIVAGLVEMTLPAPDDAQASASIPEAVVIAAPENEQPDEFLNVAAANPVLPSPASTAAATGGIAEDVVLEPDADRSSSYNPVFDMPRESSFVEFDGFGENDAYVDIGEESGSDPDSDSDDGTAVERRKTDATNGYIQLSFGDRESMSSAGSPLPPTPTPEAAPQQTLTRSRPASVYGFGQLASDSEDDLC